MWHTIHLFVRSNPIALAAVSGLIHAALKDYQVFSTWHSFADVRSYKWSVAVFNWIQGAVVGAVTGLGLAGIQ
jgi:hypothetical protein